MPDDNLPTVSKSSLREWLESFLPFQLPAIPLLQTAKNLDIAVARLVAAGSKNVVSRLEGNTKIIDVKRDAAVETIRSAIRVVTKDISAEQELAERAVNYALSDTILHQKNREQVVKGAVDEISRDPGVSDAAKPIDSDWLNQFARLSEAISVEELQSLWSKILAGEIRKPGSFRIRTLQGLSTVSKDEATLIHRLLSHSINNSYVYSVTGNTIELHELLEGEQLGVVSGVGGILSLRIKFKNGESKDILSNGFGIRIKSIEDKEVQIEACPLTPFGKDLCN